MEVYRLLDGRNHILSGGFSFPEHERHAAITRIANEIHADDNLRTDPVAAFKLALAAITAVGTNQQPELYRGRGPSFIIDSLTAIGLSMDPATSDIPPNNELLSWTVLRYICAFWDSIATDLLAVPTLAQADRLNLLTAGTQLDRRIKGLLPPSMAVHGNMSPMDSIKDLSDVPDQTLALLVARTGVAYLPILFDETLQHT